ncbi:MAG TPA: HlyD family efflux transporter periplasmic adaptor subunit [Solirubrobacterales bacterium]|jgi:multidrug efflux pump subunit AcrA (membrane-fusion protein)|nr:HlyD family efflux transporter periplasmic adaptor subunit [Solirubrobacterales bacterium]
MPPALKLHHRFRSIVAGLESRHKSDRGTAKAAKPAKAGKRRSLPGGWHNWALGLLCLLILAIAITSIGSSSSGATSEQRTAEVGRGVVQSTVSGNGSLEAAEQVELNFGASGEVTEIYVEAGEKVNKNELLARIDSSSARASLASAEAQLAEAEETLESAEEAEVSTTYDSSETTVLASYDGGGGEETSTVLLAAVEGGVQQEVPADTEKEGSGETGSGDEKAPEEKSDTTGGSGGKEPKTEPEPEKEEEAARTQQEAPAEAAPESSGAPSGGSTESASPSATVSVATAEANLRQAELTVESAEQEVNETTLRAPFSGTVASISGSVGETVSGEGSSGTSGPSSSSEASAGGLALGGGGSEAGSGESSSAFIVVTQLDRLKMEVSFSEADIGKVKVGQAATISISSMEGTELAGRVTKVDVLPSESSSGGVVEYPATILLTQRAKGLRAGMSASAEVVVEQVSDAVTVPNEAISSGPSKTVTVEEDGKEVQKTVETGLVGDESTEVLSGLEPGETLVLPEASVPTGGMEGGSGGGFPGIGGGGGVPSFGGGGPPSGFPGAP